MDIKNGTGQHMKEMGFENNKKIKKFFTENPNSTQKDCSDHTGLSVVTIRKHIKQIEKNAT